MSDATVEMGNEWDVLSIRWVWWCWTRRLLAPPVKSNVLARLQVRRSTPVDHDAFLDSEMPYFNMAVHALCDMPEHEQEASAFIGVHWYSVNIKQLAHEQQCARGTVYNRSRKFAKLASQLAQTIRKAHGSMTLIKCSNETEQNSPCVD